MLFLVLIPSLIAFRDEKIFFPLSFSFFGENEIFVLESFMLAFHTLGTHFDMDCGHTKSFVLWALSIYCTHWNRFNED